MAIPPVSPEEMLRVRKYSVKNRMRFQYRYAAADLAWEAAKSLPADDPLLARLYNTAGRWLADSDPESADRFLSGTRETLCEDGRGQSS